MQGAFWDTRFQQLLLPSKGTHFALPSDLLHNNLLHFHLDEPIEEHLPQFHAIADIFIHNMDQFQCLIIDALQTIWAIELQCMSPPRTGERSPSAAAGISVEGSKDEDEE